MRCSPAPRPSSVRGGGGSRGELASGAAAVAEGGGRCRVRLAPPSHLPRAGPIGFRTCDPLAPPRRRRCLPLCLVSFRPAPPCRPHRLLHLQPAGPRAAAALHRGRLHAAGPARRRQLRAGWVRAGGARGSGWGSFASRCGTAWAAAAAGGVWARRGAAQVTAGADARGREAARRGARPAAGRARRPTSLLNLRPCPCPSAPTLPPPALQCLRACSTPTASRTR